MALHPLAGRFASVAGEYERGRPEYPPAVIGALAAELELAPGSPVLDLAAGTGKLTRALLAGGFEVVAVEPQQALRERLAAGVGPERVRDGVAEAIPLEDGAVEGVTVGDAFHWFDHRRAFQEIARVLAPRGGLAVLNTVVDWGGASWAHEVGSLIAQLRPPHPGFDGPPWQEALRASGRFEEPREIRISAPQPAEPGRVLDHIASMSWVAALGGDERATTMERFSGLIEGGTTPAELTVHFVLGLTRLAGR